MMHTQSTEKRPTQLDLVVQPSPSQTVSDDLVPPNVRTQCVELLADLLTEVAKAAVQGEDNER
jgi:hypothetical protein